MGLSLGKGRAATTSILYALATGAIIAAYATVDAIGVRAAGHTGAYTAWVLCSTAPCCRRPSSLRGESSPSIFARPNMEGAGGGLVALLAYGVVVAAFALGPGRPDHAMRETSVVFAALIGWLFLGEILTAARRRLRGRRARSHLSRPMTI